MTVKEFRNFLYRNNKDHVTPSIDAQTGLNILIDHFLGDDWYSIFMIQEQINAEAIHKILKKYPRRKIRLMDIIRRK